MEYNLEKISHAIKKIDYSFIDWDLDIDTKWLFMKNKLTKIVDCIGPTKSMKFKQKEQFLF